MDASSTSHIGRTALMKLDENGAVEGSLTETLTGHCDEEWRAQNMERSLAQREEHFRRRLRDRLGDPEVSEIILPDPADLSKAVTLRCHIKADGYATRTGKRLIFAPAFFEMNTPARYAAAERKNPIYIRYSWSETDDITFETPDGFELDHADAPAGIALAPFINYSVKIRVAKDRIMYHRELSAVDKGTNVQPKEHYKGVKQIFDVLHDGDSHLLTLKAQSSSPVAETH
jgi:hypothetical protein